MKKLLLSFMTLFMSLMASADIVEVDGINYNLYDDTKTAEITWGDYNELVNLVIPETVEANGTTYTVTTIGNVVFSGCSKLTSVTIPNTVTKIGGLAFQYCTSLTSINIPNSVTTIENYTFLGCRSLESITLPETLTSLMWGAFMYCSSLKSINIPESNATYCSVDGVVFDKNMEAIYCYPAGKPETTYAIPSTVMTITEQSFAASQNLTTVTIPNSVTKIRALAFSECSGLTTVTIPNSVRKIDTQAFYMCDNLAEVCSLNEQPIEINDDVFQLFVDEGNMPFTSATLFVPAGTKSLYESTRGWKNFKTIKEIASITPVESETTVGTEGLSGENLTDNVVGDVYYNVGADGYDASDGSIVIGQPTNMGQIGNAAPGTDNVKNNFTGVILKVGAGNGTVTVNTKTSGNARLVVKVGDEEPKTASKSEKGDVVLNYNTPEGAFVYICSTIASNARPTRASSDDVVKIYGITITPGATGISGVKREATATDCYYTLDGRQINGKPSAKGIYIINGRKTIIR